MFDYVVINPYQKQNRPRYMTTGVSALVHGLVLALAVGLPILYASEALPEPPDMMAFVVEAPPPPPPPPPPAPPKPEKKEPAKPDQPAVKEPPPQPVAQTPVEAPKAIAPETGLESAPAKREIEAGFERGVSGGVEGGVVGGVEAAAPPPPPPPVPQGPVRVGGQIKAPQLTRRVNPAYPSVAQSAMVEGVVVLEATVDKSGRVQAVKVIRGHSLLEAAAVDAVKQWVYEPLRLNGEPASFILTVTVTFNLPK